MAPNFKQCAADYLAQPPNPMYMWKGPVKVIPPNPATQISYQGCLALCGHGIDWYGWDQASQTITTWILPIVGILLQAPFESNAFWQTVLAIARWVGSPMSSLSYTLWNISVSGKCALMVDMAVGYRPLFASTQETEDFNNIRDSFYILMVMNQFEAKPLPHMKREAEGLLRIVLFSKDLRLIEYEGRTQIKQKNLAAKRQDLAEALRRRRRRGVVPVFVSTLWFLFSLALSIQSAFGLVGENATAHDLALGLLLSWLPILVLCSIVDRNPLSADDVQSKLNALISLVCRSLQDKAIVDEYIQSYCTGQDADEMRQRVRDIVGCIHHLDNGNFFVRFAGQGRVRWHYGVAHPILSDLENVWIANHGRDWMRNEFEARNKLVLGSTDRGLFWFDWRQLWHITSAVIIVAGSSLGAYILSYYTPTVGLGCRSLGYLVFSVISLGLLILEFIIWRWTSEEREEYNAQRPPRERRVTFDVLGGERVRRASMFTVKQTGRWLEGPVDTIEQLLKVWIPRIFSSTYIGDRRHRREYLQRSVDHTFQQMRHWSARQWWNVLFFIPAELINTGWLCKIVLSQTFGAYQNCWCQTSQYSPGGGYMDLSMVLNAQLKYVMWSWVTGTVISGTILSAGLAYVVTEWCLQSHLSTLDRDAAREGLQRTRAFRRYTYYARQPLQWLVLQINGLWYIFNPPERKQKTLVWTKDITCRHHLHCCKERTPWIAYEMQRDSQILPAAEGFFSRPRSSTDADTRGLLASPPLPHIVEPPDDCGRDDCDAPTPARHRSYSNASSDRISMDIARKPVPLSYLGREEGLEVHPSVQAMPAAESLRPRPSHIRQLSDEDIPRDNNRSET
ncbi:uncharacterized protein PV09_06009 [Verruconis gallopava]|uniref:Uncharacterized protein n=1 Tax=Verruconis gallopava TaxID=253628 RepID=A0A0D2ATW1_9PEZI|nr:uncharacterized protein PV09_06009 [Verruconis gallopava]KIW02554.1 hypothetical protein PV09_06009 [Verruconis gallopava]